MSGAAAGVSEWARRVRTLRVRHVPDAGLVLLLLAALTAVALVVVHTTALSETSTGWMGLAGVAPLASLCVAAAALLGALCCFASPPGDHRRLAAMSVVVPWAVVAAMFLPTARSAVAPERAGGADEITIVVQNLWHEHPDPARAAEGVLGHRADVVVLVELTPRLDAAIDEALADLGGGHDYPYQIRRPREGSVGIGVLSKVPLGAHSDMGMSSPSIEVDLQLGDRTATLMAVHVVAPTAPWGMQRWRFDHDVLHARLDGGRPDVIVAGDFNSTISHVRLRRLLADGGLREVHKVAGVGPGLTWPAHTPFPPLMRLDHVLVGEAIGVNRSRVLANIGSDHLGVEARLVLPRS